MPIKESDSEHRSHKITQLFEFPVLPSRCSSWRGPYKGQVPGCRGRTRLLMRLSRVTIRQRGTKAKPKRLPLKSTETKPA
jgi:hypothetical protein